MKPLEVRDTSQTAIDAETPLRPRPTVQLVSFGIEVVAGLTGGTFSKVLVCSSNASN